MPLASMYGERKDVPHEPQYWLELRQIGYTDLKAAQVEARREGARSMREMGGNITAAMMRATARPTGKTVVDPINSHDPLTLLDRALLNWNYERPLPAQSDDPKQQKERLKVIGDLDDRTIKWAARTILEAAGVDNAWGNDTDLIDTEAREVGPRRLNSGVPIDTEYSFARNGHEDADVEETLDEDEDARIPT
jgi:hypothetical protein